MDEYQLAAARRLVPSSPNQLTLAIAGPGYGKTTALIQWLDTLDCSRAWVSLDSIGDSPPVFWSYVIEAVKRSTGVGSEAARMLEDEAAPYSYLNQFLAELGEVTEPLVLSLDDLHVIRSEDLIAQVSYFIERLPPAIRMAASTRIDPPFHSVVGKRRDCYISYIRAISNFVTTRCASSLAPA